MPNWITDHIEIFVAAVASFFAGIAATGRLFLGLKSEMKILKDKQDSQDDEIAQIKLEAEGAKVQRDNIEKNTKMILEHLIKGKPGAE